MFKDKILLITGGTGSFGNAVLNRFLNTDMGNFFRVPADKRDLNYEKYFTYGDNERIKIQEYTSNSAEILDVKAVKEKLLTLRYIQEEINSFNSGIVTIR